MKRTITSVFAAVLALVMALAVVPVSALPRFEVKEGPAPTWTVPEGYNAHDYTKCVEFLEQADENGVKNGEKLSGSWTDNEFIPGNYDPNDPLTWGRTASFQPVDRFIWTFTADGVRIKEVDADLYPFWSIPGVAPLVGSLDFSGCTELTKLRCGLGRINELDVSDCTALRWLDCGGNELTELDVTQNTALLTLDCNNNQLTELDVSQNPELHELYCKYNQLTELDLLQNSDLVNLHCGNNLLSELKLPQNSCIMDLFCGNNRLAELDVSDCRGLCTFYCENNRLTELDLSQNEWLEAFICYGNFFTELDLSNSSLSVNRLHIDGNGFVGYFADHETDSATARAHSGAIFEGFYDESGALLSVGEWDGEKGEYLFELPYPCDIGTIIARFRDPEPGEPGSGDINGDGEATVDDAIIDLRAAMGLLQLPPAQLEAGDMNGDGVIDVSDAIIILRKALGLIQ